MSENIKVLCDRSDIVAIADAVRSKTESIGEMTLGQIAVGIGGITGGENLDEVLEDQDDIIAQIQTALEGKASATPTLQEKTVSPSTSAQTVTPDSNYDGLSKVTVNAMPTATQATPSISVSSSGLITASATQTAGYVTTGTKSATKQLTTQAAKTITPTTSSQTAVASGVYTTGAVTVAAIPSSYVKPTTTKTATTYTPTTSNQTIAAGTYCSGAQTIAGDANLVAENIAEGVSIFGVTGTHSGGGSGGGSGSVETCAVTINSGAEGVIAVYTTYDSLTGEITTATNTSEAFKPVPSVTLYRNNLNDVIIGSAIVVFKSGCSASTGDTIISSTSTYTIFQAGILDSDSGENPPAPGEMS